MTITFNTMSQAIGRTVLVRFESVQVPCRVLDAKNSYGNPRILVTPVSGRGEQWINLNSRDVEAIGNSQLLTK